MIWRYKKELIMDTQFTTTEDFFREQLSKDTYYPEPDHSVKLRLDNSFFLQPSGHSSKYNLGRKQLASLLFSTRYIGVKSAFIGLVILFFFALRNPVPDYTNSNHLIMTDSSLNDSFSSIPVQTNLK